MNAADRNNADKSSVWRKKFSKERYQLFPAGSFASGVVAALFCGIGLSSFATAEMPDSICSEVSMEIRTVRASRPASTNFIEARDVTVDERIGDLMPKLRRLPFRNFRLLTARRIVLPLKKKETIKLRGDQMLDVRSLYVNREKIGLWLNWRDGDGMELLNTRMHFNRGEAVVAGTEGGGEGAFILAITVAPKYSDTPAEKESVNEPILLKQVTPGKPKLPLKPTIQTFTGQ